MQKQPLNFLKWLLASLFCICLINCSQYYGERKTMQRPTTQQIEDTINKLDFACVTEKIPPRVTKILPLYQYAEYHRIHAFDLYGKKKLNTRALITALLPYYRIAAAHGDYQANLRLQTLLRENKVDATNRHDEVLDLNQQLVEIMPATAYYNYALYIGGGYGLSNSEADMYPYLLKAAKLGQKDAQHFLAKEILKINDESTLQRRIIMRRKLNNCAGKQGHMTAAVESAANARIHKDYKTAVEFAYYAAKAGDLASLQLLEIAFMPPKNVDQAKFKPYGGDLERVKRYAKLGNELDEYEYGQMGPDAKDLSDLDEIVPLPPAKLKAWDGKTAMKRFYDGPSPAKPSDELMQELAKVKGLDPQTGLPLAGFKPKHKL